MTNKEYLTTLDDDLLAHILVVNIPKLCSNFFDFIEGLSDWLKQPYDKNNWVWKL